MTPEELRQANIEHFRKVLVRTRDAGERARVERLLEEEMRKPDEAYPQKRSSPAPNELDWPGPGAPSGNGWRRSP
jgi:hypothetical protein